LSTTILSSVSFTSGNDPAPHPGYADHAMFVETWRENNWKWVGENRLVTWLASEPSKAALIRGAIEAGVLVESQQVVRHADGHESQVKALILKQEHPVGQAVLHMLKWAPARIDYCLTKRMPYVDTNFLVKGMTTDATRRREMAQLGGRLWSD
jgi:hypothetical protein